jgi:hypothetical protein
MIEPTSKDVNRRVVFHRDDGSSVDGLIAGFDAEFVSVTIAGATLKLRREQLQWPLDRHRNPNAESARSMLMRENIAIVEVDEHHWKVSDPNAPWCFLFWPMTGFWRWPDGTTGGGGVRNLVNAVKGHRLKLESMRPTG